MSSEKKAFQLYLDYRDKFKSMSKEDLGYLFSAILDFENGIEPEGLPAMAQLAFDCIRGQLQHDIDEWESKSTVRSDAGKRGAGKRWAPTDDAETMANDSKGMANDSKGMANDSKGMANDSKNAVTVTDTVTVKEKGCTNVHPKKKSASFAAPCVSEVRAYCEERHNSVDPEAFVDFYQSKNWMVGKNHMVDWKAAVRNWERDSRTRAAPPADRNSAVIAGFLARHAEEDSG